MDSWEQKGTNFSVTPQKRTFKKKGPPHRLYSKRVWIKLEKQKQEQEAQQLPLHDLENQRKTPL